MAANGDGNGNGRLTRLQDRWVVEYCKDLNATQAARRAGYNGGYMGWARRGHENRYNSKIQQKVKDRLTAMGMGEEEVTSRIAILAKSSLEDVMHFSEDGYSWKIDIVGAHERGTLYAVKSIEETQHGLRVRMEDKLRALELLGKAHGMFTDVQEQKGEVIMRVVYDKDTD